MKAPDHKTKIVCTIGPASESPGMLRQLIEAGMDVARLNFSHGEFASHRRVVDGIRAAAVAAVPGDGSVLPFPPTPSASSGAEAGATLALTLIGGALATNYGFEARPLSLWLINAGYMVVGMTIMGAIIGHWRKQA